MKFSRNFFLSLRSFFGVLSTNFQMEDECVYFAADEHFGAGDERVLRDERFSARDERVQNAR